MNATMDRRRMIASAGLAGGGIASMGVFGSAFAQTMDATPMPDATPMSDMGMTFESPVDVLNFALTLEHLEAAFYRDGLAAITAEGITALGFEATVFDALTEIGQHEAAHVTTLTDVITQLGGEPVAEAEYNFGYTDAASFLQVAQALEDTGVSAYQGAAQYLIEEDELLTSALTIHGVEARHASYLALLNAQIPFPAALNPTLTPEEVMTIAAPFIPSLGASQTDLPAPGMREGTFLDIADGARIFYQVSGEGEPMLLLHGYPLSGALFARVRDALSAQYMVITVDHRGYGMSETPAVPDNVAIYATDAMAVLDELGVEQAIIGGHSMGGPITFEMYKLAPERFRAMILIDTIAAPASPIEAGLWQGFADEAQANGISAAYVNNLIKEMLSGETRVNQPELVQYLSAVVGEVSVESAVGGALALANRPDYMSLLGQIEVPTLVYVGVEDTVYPVPISQMLAEALPNSTLVTIPGASHAAIFEAPDESSQAIIDWAKQLS